MTYYLQFRSGQIVSDENAVVHSGLVADEYHAAETALDAAKRLAVHLNETVYVTSRAVPIEEAGQIHLGIGGWWVSPTGESHSC